MKKILFSVAWILLTVLCLTGSASATLVGGPSPRAGFGNDNGAELFIPDNRVVNLELYDIDSLFNVLLLPTFGFYFQGTDVTDPANRITIFGPDDEAGSLQYASINFTLGWVYDVDALGIQSTFTNLPGKSIGFFFSTIFGEIYTEAALNNGIDLAATFPSLTEPLAYLISFEGLQGGTLALEVTNGITPVPEPSTLLLLVSGIAGMALLRRRNW